MYSEFSLDFGTSSPFAGLTPQNFNAFPWEVVKSQLQELASAPNGYGRLDSVFDIPDPSAAQAMLFEWSNGIFPNMPALQVVPDAVLSGAGGAYAAQTGTIYLAESTLEDPLLGVRVLAEEVGHHVDELLNPGGDALGDEGELFSKVLFNDEIDSGELARLKAEDDRGVIAVGNDLLSVEYSQIAIEFFGERLYQSLRGTDNRIYTRYSYDGKNWSGWDEDGGTTYDAPALAAFGGKLYQSHRGTDNRIYTRYSYDGANWSGWDEDGGTTYDAPALAAFGGKLYQSHRGTDNRIYTRFTYNGRDWSGWDEDGGTTYDAPALAAFGGKLYQSHRGTNNRIYTRYSYDGIGWSNWDEDGGTTYDAVAIEGVGNKLYQSHRGTDNRIYTRFTYNGRDWSGWDEDGGITYDAPSLANIGTKLYQSHKGTDNNPYTRYSDNGLYWSDWHQ